MDIKTKMKQKKKNFKPMLENFYGGDISQNRKEGDPELQCHLQEGPFSSPFNLCWGGTHSRALSTGLIGHARICRWSFRYTSSKQWGALMVKRTPWTGSRNEQAVELLEQKPNTSCWAPVTMQAALRLWINYSWIINLCPAWGRNSSWGIKWYTRKEWALPLCMSLSWSGLHPM